MDFDILFQLKFLQIRDLRPNSIEDVQDFFFLKIYFYYFFFYWKGGYTERRDREEDLPSDDSLPK